MASFRPSNGYNPGPSRPAASIDDQRTDASQSTYSTSRSLPHAQPGGSRLQPGGSYLPAGQQVPPTVPASSPSELKRRRPPSQQPSAFTLTAFSSDTADGATTPTESDKYHPSDGEFISRDDYNHSSISPLLPSSSSSSPTTAYRSARRNSDPDDKHRHSLLRRFLMRFSLYKAIAPHGGKSHSRHLSLEKGLGSHSHSKAPSQLWDREQPLYSALRIAFAVCAVVVLVTVFTLLVHGGPTALLYISHPFSHLLSPFFSTPEPSISPLSTSASSSSPSIYTPALLSAVTPSLSSSDFTLVASFYVHEQSSPVSARLLQWHSLLSFASLTPPAHVIVYTNQPTLCAEFVSKAFPAMQCFYPSDFFNVEFQLPYVDRLLAHAHAHALDDLIVYTHHDALLSSELAATIHHLTDVLPYHQFVATSRRLETRLPFELVALKDFGRSFVNDIVKLGRAMNRPYANEWNVDLLVYSRYWFEQLTGGAFPPFVFADYYWSNHLLGQFLLSPHLTTVDLSAQRLLLHLKSNDTVDGVYVADMRALSQHNLRLARNASDRYLYGQLNNIPYQLTGRCPACALQLSGSGSVDLLARKQAEQGWLLVVEAGEHDAGRVWNWLCWAERANVSNYLLVTDSAATPDYQRMYELGFPLLFTDAGEGSTGLIGYLLQKGYSVLTMDLDHLPLQRPWAYLQASPFDVMVKGDDANFYAGMLALRASHYSHYFYAAVTQCTAASPRRGADVLAACAAHTFRDMRLSVKGGVLDILHFPTVKSFFIDQLSTRAGVYPLVLETSAGWLDELSLDIHRADGQCEAAQRPPFEPFGADTPITVRVLTSTNLPGLKALLASLAQAQYEPGVSLQLEVAIDYPRGPNVTSSVVALYQQVVSYASSFVWAQGGVLVSVQEAHVGSARLLVADHDESSEAHVLLLSDDVRLSSMWHATLRRLLALCAQQPDSQLMGVALTAEDGVLGETHAKRSVGRHAMEDIDRLLGTATPLFGWQQPSSAVLLFPGFYHELLYFVDRMQTAYPNYHPCVPTLVTNHRRRYVEFVSKWMYTRGLYLLHLNLPGRHALAVQTGQAAAGEEPRYVPQLLNLQTYTQMRVGELALPPGALRVLDFHMVERAAGVLESRALVERRAKQCWVQSDWRDEAEAIAMDEDELMSEAEEERRHAAHRERQAKKQSELAALAAQHQTSDRGANAVGLEGHKVATEAVAGVHVAGGQGQGGAGKQADWERAAARDIAESQANNHALAMKEVQAGNAEAGQPAAAAPAAAAAAPAAPPATAPPAAAAPAAAPAPAAPAGPAAGSDEAIAEALKNMTPEQRHIYEQLNGKDKASTPTPGPG